jgi:N-acetylneuraminic acid mutarotase
VWLPAWKEGPSLTTARAGSAAVSFENYIYVLGGVDGRQFLSSIERASVDDRGTISDWKIVAHMPQPRGFFDAVVVNNWLYIVGGGNGENGKNLLNSVYRAEIQRDGSLGEWRIDSELLIPRRCVKVLKHKRRLYALGGFGGTLLDTVEFADIKEDGSLGDWQLSDQAMTIPRYVNAAKELKGQFYVMGGHHQTNGTGISFVESAIPGKQSLHWIDTHRPLKHGRYGLAAVVVKNKLYVMGGLSGLEYLHSVERFDETNNQWQETTALPHAAANFSTVKVRDYIYILGGTTRRGYLAAVNYAQTNKSGEIGVFVTAQQAEQYQTSLKQQTESPPKLSFAHQGIVEDVILTDQYTYVLVKENSKRYWIAGPILNVSIGAKVGFSEGVLMSGFYSKSLRRNFDKILFVSQLVFIK